MKRFGKFAYLVIVLGVATFAFFEFREDMNAPVAENEVRLFTNNPVDINEIELLAKDNRTILKRADNTWRIERPISDVAEDVAVQALLMQLYGERGRTFSNATGTDLSKFGLAEPVMIVRLRSNHGSEEIAVGSLNAFDGSYYLKLRNQILLGDKAWARILQQSAHSLRRRQVLPDMSEVQKIQIDDFSLVRSAEGWTSEKPFSIDKVKVEHWLDQLQSIKASGFENEVGKMESTRHTIVLETKNGPLAVKFAKEEDSNVFVMTSHKPTVYRVSANSLANILVGPDHFRDGKIPFEFPLERASKISVRSRGKDFSLTKMDLEWRVNGGAVEQSKVIQWMQSLRSLEAVDFPKNPKGLADSPSLTVTGSSNEKLLQIFVGDIYKATSGLNSGADLNYVSVAGQKAVLGVKSSLIKELLESDFLK